MKTKFNTRLFEKTIDIKNKSLLRGGGNNYCRSGGTEVTPTGGCHDTITRVYDDDCNLSSEEHAWVL
jgi:hypothetical protein